MIFDIKTLILLLLAIATINMGALWLLWLNNRRRFAGISFWLADMMCQFAGAGLILVRGRVPDFLSVVVANTFVISGALLLLIGLERFTGKQRRQGWNYVAAAAAPVLLTYFLFVQPSLKVREIVISAALLLFAAQASWLLLRRVSPSLRPVTRLTGLVLAGYAAVSLTRISLHLVIPAQTNDFFQTGLVNSLAMTFYIMLNVSLTISLIAMVNRRLVEQILAQEEKYARVFRSAPYAVTLTSLPTGQIFEVNDGFVQMSGYTGDEIVGKTMLDLNVWANPEDRNSLLEGLVAQGHLPAREVQFRRKSGELLTGLISAQVIVVNDEPCVMSSISDISERKQMENDLAEAKNAAEAANRAKSEFLASISHELRTPLNAILGFSELMARDANLTAKQHENLAIINRSGDHLLALINDVLDMARIEAGRTVLQEGDFNLHHLLEDIADLFRLRAESKGISLTLTVWPGLPRWVHADQGKLRQILINLLSNAVKFTPSGRIDLSAQRTGGDDDRLLIAVQDTGSGILPADLTAIFEPFVQSANGHNAPDGTGLGLPISQQFARLMGGDLTAFSAGIPGEGSRFEVVLPLRLAVADGEADRPLADRPRAVCLAPGQPDYRLLVAEDHAESRELLAGLLTQLGFAVRTAGNGQEAIQVWEEWQPHLIWMDMRMPALDGHETTRRIKATAQGQQTVIVAISAGVLSDKHAAMRADGCDDFVGKPYRAEEIVACLVKHLGVQMVYADAPSVTPAAALPAIDLTALPAGWAAQVRQAALAADAGQLLALAAEIKAAQPELAAALRRSIDDFDYDAILETGGIMMDRPLFHSLSTT